MLGEGAFGRVYSAVRKSDELKVAIKEISKRKIPNYEEGLPLEVKNLFNKTSFILYKTITVNSPSTSSRRGRSCLTC